MLEMIWKPTLHGFDTCKEFVEAFRLNRDDLILSNAYIYKPYFGCMENLNCYMIFQEKYGAREPTDVMVNTILADATKTSRKRAIAVGGGTVVDVAKALAISDGEGVDDLYDKAPGPEGKRGLIIIPATCGTGSEVTNISIMARTRVGTRLGPVSPAIHIDYVVLIPQLPEGLLLKVFAASSVDALIRAVESALSPKATPYTRLFGYKAIEMVIRSYQTITKKGSESRFSLLNDFLLASNYAGLAFSTTDCAAVHATSYPLGGRYHMAHDKSNYAVFTGMLRNYMELRQDGEIVALNQYLTGLPGCIPDMVYDELEKLLDQILPKRPPHGYGVTKEDLPVLAHSVVTGQGRLMASNFIPLDETRILKIYRELF